MYVYLMMVVVVVFFLSSFFFFSLSLSRSGGANQINSQATTPMKESSSIEMEQPYSESMKIAGRT